MTRRFLVHHNVTIARQLYRQFRSDDGKGWKLAIAGCQVLSDVRVIDMYDEVIQSDRPLEERTGNWAQPYFTPEDAREFLVTQFADPDRIRQLIDRASAGG